MTQTNERDANLPGLLTLTLEKNALNEEEARLFAHWLCLLRERGLTYAVGGAFAIHAYTGILRNTKDLDIYIQPAELKAALSAFRDAGYRTEVTDRTWLAKVFNNGDYFMDLLFGMPRQRFLVEDAWFERRRTACILDVDVDVLGVEELFVSKVFLAKSYRFDGSDLLHLILRTKGAFDWQRILRYLGNERELLLWYLLLFNFVYPGRAYYLPRQLMVDLFEEIRESWKSPRSWDEFRGTLLDPNAFAVDCRQWGYKDQGVDRNLVDEDGEAD